MYYSADTKYDNPDTRLTDACDKARLACESLSRTTVSAYAWFDADIQKNNAMKFHIMRNFDKALENGWIHVYYQPIIRTMTRTVCNCEALARWIDPVYGMISPAQFIPILEETGQICQLDLYVLEQVCKDYVKIMKEGIIPIPASVNLSRNDFLHDDLPDAIDRISKKYGVPREFTNLEITESFFIKNVDKVDRFIQRFHQMGYKVWMDDFGSGYSSLGVLKNYSFDKLKLDMSFMRDFDDKSRQIITAIVRMAKKLDISTLAEGVETEEQFLFLREIGCENIQGYFFAPPMPEEKLKSYLQQRGLEPEEAIWRSYLTRLSRIDYLTDESLCVVDDDGETLKILFANKAYKEILAKDNVLDLKEWEYRINVPGDPVHMFHRQYADQQLRRKEGPQTAAYPSGDHYMQLTASVVARQGSHCLYAVHIQYVKVNVTDLQQASLGAMGDLYYLCNDIAVYDLENDTVLGIKSSLSDQPMGVGTELHHIDAVIHAWRMNYCYLPDQERLADFLDVTTMKARLEKSRNHALMDFFRSMTASGEYQWFLHILIPVQRSDFNKVLHVTVNAVLPEADIQEIAALYHQEYKDHTHVEMSGDILWKNMIMNAKRRYFWKDDRRRFVGASKSFLQYFGIQSEKEIIGKTDEDMGWHIHPGPFRRDEEEVLRKGRKFYLRNGDCIINGSNRHIVVSKIPVYRDGRIIGILGTMIDAAEEQQSIAESRRLSSVDPVTGLANARGVSDGVYSFLIERWRTGMNFAMIEVYVPEYREVIRLYGDSSGDRLLQKVGCILKDCAGRNCIIGRTQESYFDLIMRFTSKEEVRNVARKIRTAIESVRQAGQWSGNCSVVIRASYTDPSSREPNAYLRGLSGLILNSDDTEDL